MPSTEYEAKLLDIDPATIVSRIVEAGGRHVGTHLMRRYVYDTVPAVPGRWVRLRDAGSETTLCVKEIASEAVDGTRETETTVGDFETMHELLERTGLRARSYQENRRDSWLMGRVRLEIDTWPRIPPYLEIEADDAAQVWATAERLGISKDDLTSENTKKVYARHGIDLDSVPDLRL